MKIMLRRKGKTLNIENSINITDNALDKIINVMNEEENPDLKLRLYISGGGCSGLQYGFAFETKIEDDDYILKKKENGDGAFWGYTAKVLVALGLIRATVDLLKGFF